MAINPEDISTVRTDQLPADALTLASIIAHAVATETPGVTDLKQATVSEFVDLVATAVGVLGGIGFLPISVTDGQQLPDVPENPSFFLCGAGTYLNINGYADVICTGQLNAVMSLSDHWEVAIEIPITVLATLNLQQVVTNGRTFTETVGDYTYINSIFLSGAYELSIVNNVTGDVRVIDVTEANITISTIDGDNSSTISIGDGSEIQLITSNPFGTNQINVPFKTEGSGDISTFRPPNNKPTGDYDFALDSGEKRYRVIFIENFDSTISILSTIQDDTDGDITLSFNSLGVVNAVSASGMFTDLQSTAMLVNQGGFDTRFIIDTESGAPNSMAFTNIDNTTDSIVEFSRTYLEIIINP